MTPWVLTRPSQFRLPPPLALDSPEYAVDLNELKTVGVLSGSLRTADQSELALFWQGNTPLYWNRIAAQISAKRGLALTENAHLFALLNVSLADAAIACWDSKYPYVFWRPITAIRTGITPADADPTWEPWLDFFKSGTPAHPEYPSAHSSVSAPPRSSSPPRLETIRHLRSPRMYVPAHARFRVSQARSPKSRMRAFLAGFISEPRACAQMRWEEPWQITCRDTQCVR